MPCPYEKDNQKDNVPTETVGTRIKVTILKVFHLDNW